MKIDKFMKLADEKKDRILNAAMQEFSYGYEKASTNVISKNACIAKGSLFHYFGTKKQFYTFLVWHTMDILEKDYYQLLDLKSRDIFDSLWHEALATHHITRRYPYIYQFYISIQVHLDDLTNDEFTKVYEKKKKKQFEVIDRDYDTILFQDEIDPAKAVKLILWAVEGFYDELQGKEKKECYDVFLNSLRAYLDTLRTCFYN
jgi:AcrR family transcriptional regulator